MFQLTEKVTIVTRASRGIGRTIAKGFGKAGVNLVLVSRDILAVERRHKK
jgi:short-subunit dehydrogenase